MSNSKRDLSEEAISAIASCVAQGNRQMSDLESQLWVMAMGRASANSLFEFACFWASGSGQRSAIPRAPMISDFDSWLSPSEADHLTALDSLHKLVTSQGPYNDPKDTSPKMLHAIDLLGGWVKVCETMPAKEGVAWAVFAKAFESVWSAAKAQAHHCDLNKQAPPRALGLSSASAALQVTFEQHSPPAEVDALRA